MENKNLANRIVVAVFFAFVLAAGLKHYYKQVLVIELFFTVTEAALIGGVADWFAITALFKKPLGFPWHTALIPRHREKVIRSIRDVIVQDLLTVESLKKKVDNSCFVAFLVSFIENKRGQVFVKNSLDRFCKETVNKLDVKEVVSHMQGFMRREIKNIELTSQIQHLIRWLLEDDRVRILVMYIVEELIQQLENATVKQSIYQYLEDITQLKSKSPLEKAFFWLGEQTNSVSLADAADAFYAEIMFLLEEVKNPDHIIHKKIYEKLAGLAEQPEFNFTWLEQAEDWKMTLAAETKFGAAGSDLLESFLKAANSSLYPQFFQWLCVQMERYWLFFKENRELKDWLELRIKQVLYQFIEREHYIIGEIVQRVLGEFTNDRLNHFVEEKAGEDLQWIRINGSIVGGIVGMIMFFFMHFFYQPYLLPMIRSWF